VFVLLWNWARVGSLIDIHEVCYQGIVKMTGVPSLDELRLKMARDYFLTYE
jgi:hypothetical protein